MRYIDKGFLIYDSDLGVSGSKYSVDTLESLGGTSNISLKLHEPTGLVIPYFKNKTAIGANQVNLNDFIENSIKTNAPYESIKVGLNAMLQKQNITANEETYKAIYSMPHEAKANKELPVQKGTLAYATEISASKELRKRIVVDEVSYPHPNKTYPRLSETDKLGVRLADADIIVEHPLNTEFAKTTADSTFPPYPDMVYRTTEIGNILNAPIDKRKEKIKNAITKLRNDYGQNISAQQEAQMIKNFREMPADHVLGNPENDNIEIQEYEMDFYENLVEFIKYHIKRFNREVMSGSSDEEIEKKSNDDFEKGNLPARLVEYLSSLLYDILYHSYYHTGNFNYMLGDLEVEDDDGGSEKDVSDMLVVVKEDRSKSDLDVYVASYLITSSEQMGAQVWAEAIVKLMRFGSMKPYNLIVGVNNTQYLDMYKLQNITAELSDLSSFDVHKDEEGRSLEIIVNSYIEFNNPETNTPHSYPFVLVANETGSLPNVDDTIDVMYTTTLFDMVNDYIKGRGNIKGISFDGSKFVSDYKLEELSEVGPEHLTTRKTLINDELMDYAIDNGVQLMKGTAFSVLNKDDVEGYISSEPLIDRLAQTPKVLRMLTIQGALNYVFSLGALDYESNDLVELLNWYYSNLYSTHSQKYSEMLGLENPNTKNIVTLEATNFFGISENDEEENENNDSAEEKFMYNIYDGKLPGMHKLVKSKTDTTIIGGLANIPNKGYVFAHISEVEAFPVAAKEIAVISVITLLLGATLTADPDSEINTNVSVASEQTITKIFKDIQGK